MSRALSQHNQNNSLVLPFISSFIGVMAAIPVSMAVVTPMVQSQLAGAQSGFVQPVAAHTDGSGSGTCWEESGQVSGASTQAQAGRGGAFAASGNGAFAVAGENDWRGGMGGARSDWRDNDRHDDKHNDDHDDSDRHDDKDWKPAGENKVYNYSYDHSMTETNNYSETRNETNNVNSNNTVGSNNTNNTAVSVGEDAEDVDIEVNNDQSVDYDSEVTIEDSYNTDSNNETTVVNDSFNETETNNTAIVTDNSNQGNTNIDESFNEETTTTTETTIETDVEIDESFNREVSNVREAPANNNGPRNS